MKKILIALLVCAPLFAVKSVKLTHTAALPLNTVYSLTDPKSRVMSDLAPVYRHFLGYNGTSDLVACILDDSSMAIAPSVGDARELHIPSNTGVGLDNVSVAKNIYCRVEGKAALVASEDLLIHVW